MSANLSSGEFSPATWLSVKASRALAPEVGLLEPGFASTLRRQIEIVSPNERTPAQHPWNRKETT